MSTQKPKLIFLTFDGIRIDEFRGNPLAGDCFAASRALFQERGRVFGIDNSFRSPHPSWTSLPCYQTLMTGNVVATMDNEAGRIHQASWLDQAAAAGFRVAAAASWAKLEMAVSLQSDSFPRSCGPQRGDALPPWEECRWDKDTHTAALSYWRSGVDILYVSLADSDDLAHLEDWDGYLSACRSYDEMIRSWYQMALLESQMDQRDVWIIATTDHGRGQGSDWVDHNSGISHSQWIWAMVTSVQGEDLAHLSWESHLDVHATVQGRWLRGH